MTQTIVAFLTDEDVQAYAVDTETGRVSQEVQTPVADGVAVIAIVAGQDVLQSRASVPKVSGRRGETAARFAIEERLAVDPAQVHVAVSDHADEAGQRRVWAVDPQRMEQWIKALAERDFAADIMAPDYALLSDHGDLNIVQLPWGAAVTQGQNLGATLDEDLVPAVLEEVVANADEGRALVAAAQPARVTPLSGWRGLAVEQTAPPDLSELALTASAERAKLASRNLLQGAYRPKTHTDLGWAMWRRPAALAASVALIWITAVLVDAGRLSTGAEAAYAEAEQVLRDTLPGTTRIVNPRAQLRAALASGGGQTTGFLESAALLNEALAGSEGVRVEALRFDPDDGVLNITLNYSQYQELEQVSRALEARGARVTEGGSRQSGGRVIGDLTVRGP